MVDFHINSTRKQDINLPGLLELTFKETMKGYTIKIFKEEIFHSVFKSCQIYHIINAIKYFSLIGRGPVNDGQFCAVQAGNFPNPLHMTAHSLPLGSSKLT